jgi:hypothetical protein
VRAHFAGPRWIAEEVALAGDEATLSLEKEMEEAYASFAAQAAPHAAVALAAVSEARTDVEETIAEAVASPAPQVDAPPAVYAMASAAAAGEAASRITAVTVLTVPESPVSEAPAEKHQEEISNPAYAASEAQAVTENPNMETDIVGGTEIMAANWKNIRDSIAGAAAKPAPAKEEFQEAEPVKAEAEPAPAVEAAERATTAPAATDPKAIASIVDSVLAELRPRIVEEIARKLADSKKD